MAEVFDFGKYRDPQDMSKEELLARLAQLQEEIAQLDESEPEDMESEAYELWGEQHEYREYFETADKHHCRAEPFADGWYF